MSSRDWQDVMIEHKTDDSWVDDAKENGMLYCGRLCETILKLEAENKLMEEFIEDCSVSHHETRYKYRAQSIKCKLEKMRDVEGE